MNPKDIITTVLSKLQFLDSNQELDLEALMVWVFLLITAFRALFANVTLVLGHDIKWNIPDINLASTLPILYSIMSNSHRRYLDSNSNKNQSGKGDTANGQSNTSQNQTGS